MLVPNGPSPQNSTRLQAAHKTRFPSGFKFPDWNLHFCKSSVSHNGSWNSAAQTTKTALALLPLGVPKINIITRRPQGLLITPYTWLKYLGLLHRSNLPRSLKAFREPNLKGILGEALPPWMNLKDYFPRYKRDSKLYLSLTLMHLRSSEYQNPWN